MEGSAAERAAASLPLVLASSSPQRRAILERLGVGFTVRPAEIEELSSGDPAALVTENARRKAHAARTPGSQEAVLGCDTIVVHDGVVFGKPASEEEARETLCALSDTTHEVLSGLVLLLPSVARNGLARTRVTFRALGADLIDWYLATGEWRGRAGGYAIQGAGAALVRGVEGDYENVVGLPLATLLDLYPELLDR
jgi:septum formation protein